MFRRLAVLVAFTAVSMLGANVQLLPSLPNAAAQQINVQVPYEIDGQTTVQMQVVDQQNPLPLSETFTLGVVQRQPTVFLAPSTLGSLFPGYTVCSGVMTFGVATLALNADGTLNDCANPAIAGSVVTVFVDGLGPVTPALTTGAIAAAPPVALTPSVAATGSRVILNAATLSVPGAITGVAQLQSPVAEGVARWTVPGGAYVGRYALALAIDPGVDTAKLNSLKRVMARDEWTRRRLLRSAPWPCSRPSLNMSIPRQSLRQRES